VLRVCILPIAHHTCATGNLLSVVCYPQRTAYTLWVAILGALRVSFFVVVDGCDVRITCVHGVLMLCSGALLKGVP
jgi:hypothetical protein